jgi:hypothetical protein
VIIFDSGSGLPLFSRVDENIDSTLFSGFMSAIRRFSSHLSLGGLSSFTTEEKVVFLAATARIVTALITSGNSGFKNMYAVAYEVSEKFEVMYNNKIGRVTKVGEYRDFNNKYDEILVNNSLLAQDAGLPSVEFKPEVPIRSKQETKVIYLYTVNQQGELVAIDYNNQADLSNYPLLVMVNTIIKQIYVLENGKDISSRLLFQVGRAATKLNNKRWKNEFQIRNIFDHFDCARLIEQVSTLIEECDINQQE